MQRISSLADDWLASQKEVRLPINSAS